MLRLGILIAICLVVALVAVWFRVAVVRPALRRRSIAQLEADNQRLDEIADKDFTDNLNRHARRRR